MIFTQLNVSRGRRQTGFTMLELIIVLAIVAIVAGIAVVAIGSVRDSLQANRAMYQVMESLRRARMLAISETDEVVIVAFTRSRISVSYENPSSDIGQGKDPTLELEEETGYQFTNGVVSLAEELCGDEDDEDNKVYGELLASSEDFLDVVPPSGFVFTEDGFLVKYNPVTGNNIDDPIISAAGIFIGPPDNRPVRAVTILGVTGRIDGWRLKGTSCWERVK